MNQLTFDKDMELIDFCANKCDELAKNWRYCLSSTKVGKQWNYYMAIRIRLASRLMKEV
mgnify:CR=1 FL=1